MTPEVRLGTNRIFKVNGEDSPVEARLLQLQDGGRECIDEGGDRHGNKVA